MPYDLLERGWPLRQARRYPPASGPGRCGQLQIEAPLILLLYRSRAEKGMDLRHRVPAHTGKLVAIQQGKERGIFKVEIKIA